mgnify:CR=1 FL=1
MAVKNVAMKGDMCDCKHHKLFGWLVLIIGVLYLLGDLNVISLLGWLNWWTVAFVFIGLSCLCSCCGKGKMF